MIPSLFELRSDKYIAMTNESGGYHTYIMTIYMNA